MGTYCSASESCMKSSSSDIVIVIVIVVDVGLSVGGVLISKRLLLSDEAEKRMLRYKTCSLT